jgi:hypothetical protein
MNNKQDLFSNKKIIYTAQSKHFYYAKMFICKYTIEQNAVPLNPFNIWSYFMNDTVDRDSVRCGNNNIIRISDEVWVFGPIANGVYDEIVYAQSLKKPLKFFSLGSSLDHIKPIEINQLSFEECVSKDESEALKKTIQNYAYLQAS